mmetsp:Transcript_15314/g.63608  ORF Transcript_15314/g.63608 Transcript_15314/m.63608 type:complete len:328 (+) Transcript_15314:103-1086(+)
MYIIYARTHPICQKVLCVRCAGAGLCPGACPHGVIAAMGALATTAGAARGAVSKPQTRPRGGAGRQSLPRSRSRSRVWPRRAWLSRLPGMPTPASAREGPSCSCPCWPLHASFASPALRHSASCAPWNARRPACWPGCALPSSDPAQRRRHHLHRLLRWQLGRSCLPPSPHPRRARRRRLPRRPRCLLLHAQCPRRRWPRDRWRKRSYSCLARRCAQWLARSRWPVRTTRAGSRRETWSACAWEGARAPSRQSLACAHSCRSRWRRRSHSHAGPCAPHPRRPSQPPPAAPASTLSSLQARCSSRTIRPGEGRAPAQRPCVSRARRSP